MKLNTELKCLIFMIVFWLLFVTVMIWIGCENRKEARAKEEKEKIAIFERGYIQACKDFYKGKLKYDLVENGDGTREWKEIKK